MDPIHPWPVRFTRDDMKWPDRQDLLALKLEWATSGTQAPPDCPAKMLSKALLGCSILSLLCFVSESVNNLWTCNTGRHICASTTVPASLHGPPLPHCIYQGQKLWPVPDRLSAPIPQGAARGKKPETQRSEFCTKSGATLHLKLQYQLTLGA